jgi:serine/threonine protein kinase/tetratricopeptide (TPR) repeat protein
MDDRFLRLRDWFDRAADAAEHTRASVLAACRAEDPSLADEVERLLVTHQRVERSRTASATAIAVSALDAASGPAPGSRAGVYQLQEMIGSGGMGRVFRATRTDGLIEQEVAIKLLRREALNPALLRRFSLERQVLASLDHPGIARLLDAATLEDGTPYVVMELIRGQPLCTWCDARRLSIEERLRLFLRVLDAVAHAHRSLVVHRDLKSSNILVTEDGIPKLLDFGIAKPISPGVTNYTLTAERFFTPSSAAPEQIRGGPVTVGVDVYGLGVLLQELLVGKPPFAVDGLTPGQVEQLIQRVPPPDMSTRLGADDLPVARARSLNSVEVLRRRLLDDLDPIVERCLRKDPRDRYASVEQLAADIGNALAGRPVSARAGRRWYRLRKFVRRNLGAVALSASAALLASVAVTVIVRQAILVAAERDRATLERDRARQAVNLLKRAFEAADPSQTAGAQVTARQVLTAARPEMELTLADQPELYAELASTIAEAELSLGLSREAGELADRAARVSEGAAVSVERRAHLLGLSARAAIRTAEYPEAEAALLEAEKLGPPSLELQSTRGALLIQLGRYDEAVAVLRAAVAGLATAPPSDSGALRARRALGDALRLDGRYDESLAVLDETLAWQRAVLPQSHPDLARTRMGRAGLLHRVGRPGEAVTEARSVLADFDRIYGAQSTASAGAHTTLGNALREIGDARTAAFHYEAALANWRVALGAGNPQALRAQFNLAQLYVRNPELTTPAHLESLYRGAVELGSAAFGDDHPTMAVFRLGYAEFLLNDGRPQRAMEILVVPRAEEALLAAGAFARETYAIALLQAFDRSGCRVASNSNTGLDRARVLEELPLIRASRCTTDPQVRSGP